MTSVPCPPPPDPTCHALLRAQPPVCLLLAELFAPIACVSFLDVPRPVD